MKKNYTNDLIEDFPYLLSSFIITIMMIQCGVMHVKFNNMVFNLFYIILNTLKLSHEFEIL